MRIVEKKYYLIIQLCIFFTTFVSRFRTPTDSLNNLKLKLDKPLIMSKTLIFSVVTSIVATVGSATYFFPVVESINSIFNSEVETNTKMIDNNSENSKINTTTVGETEITRTDLNPENPKVLLNEDSIKNLNKIEDNYGPSKSKILEGEIPANKNY